MDVRTRDEGEASCRQRGQATAKPGFAWREPPPARRYRPLKRGVRFSTKARIPSF